MLKLNLKSTLLLTALACASGPVYAAEMETDHLASGPKINRLMGKLVAGRNLNDIILECKEAILATKESHEESIQRNNKAIVALDEFKAKCKEFQACAKELTSNPRDAAYQRRSSIFNFERDKQAIFARIFDFTNTYNELSEFVQEKTAEGADLYGCDFIHQVMNELKAKILVPVAGLAPTDYNVIPVTNSNKKEFGLNFMHNAIENYSRIEIDLEKLLTTIANESEKLEKLFSLQVEISDPQFKIERAPKVLHANLGGKTILVIFMRDIAGALTGKFEVGGVIHEAEMTDDEGGMYGPKGTILEGLQVYHTDLASLPNGASTWASITITQGVTHLLEGIMDSKLDPCVITLPELNDRPQRFIDYFANEQNDYARKTLEEEKKIKRIEEQADKEVDRMLKNFQGIYLAQAQLNQVTNMLDSLK